MDIYGLKKDQFLLKVFFKNRSVRKLPLSFQLYLRKILKHEKFVRVGDKTVILSQMPPYPGLAFDRYFEGLLKTAGGGHVPLSLEFAVTNKCRYKCWHCSNVHRKDRELTSQQIIDIIDDFLKLGVTWVGLTGGEPMLRVDIVDIIENIDDRASTALFTSGDRLTPDKAKALKNAGLFSIVVSLDSISAKQHDRFRGIDGAYEIATSALKLSRELEFYTVVSSVATRSNVRNNELSKLLELGRSLGSHEIRVLEIAQSGKLISDFDEVLTRDDREEVIALHKNANADGKYPRVMAFPYLESPDMLGCPGGFHHLTVDAGGNVTPCPFTPLSLGNVIDDSVNNIWSRFKEHIKYPRCNCINNANIARIRSCFDKSLPIPFEESSKILKESENELRGEDDESVVPTFYRKLGVKRK